MLAGRAAPPWVTSLNRQTCTPRCAPWPPNPLKTSYLTKDTRRINQACSTAFHADECLNVDDCAPLLRSDSRRLHPHEDSLCFVHARRSPMLLHPLVADCCCVRRSRSGWRLLLKRSPSRTCARRAPTIRVGVESVAAVAVACSCSPQGFFPGHGCPVAVADPQCRPSDRLLRLLPLSSSMNRWPLQLLQSTARCSFLQPIPPIPRPRSSLSTRSASASAPALRMQAGGGSALGAGCAAAWAQSAAAMWGFFSRLLPPLAPTASLIHGALSPRHAASARP